MAASSNSTKRCAAAPKSCQIVASGGKNRIRLRGFFQHRARELITMLTQERAGPEAAGNGMACGTTESLLQGGQSGLKWCWMPRQLRFFQ